MTNHSTPESGLYAFLDEHVKIIHVATPKPKVAPAASDLSTAEIKKIGVAAAKAGPRPLNEIARDISHDWSPVNFGAVPYLQAMRGLSTVESFYGAERGRDIVAYFLANSAKWKGTTATRIKAELRTMIGQKV